MHKFHLILAATALCSLASPAIAGFTFKAGQGSCRAFASDSGFALEYTTMERGNPVNRAMLVLQPNITPMGQDGGTLAVQIKLGGSDSSGMIDVTPSMRDRAAQVFDMGDGSLGYVINLPGMEIDKFEGKTQLVIMYDNNIISYHDFEGPLVAPLKECAAGR